MRTKWFMLLTIAIFLVIFGRMVETPSLSKSAVVLGIGIDYDKATSQFEVSAQSVLVGSSSGDTSETSYVCTTAKGNSIAGAMDVISRKTGLIISLSHCNVLLCQRLRSSLTICSSYIRSPECTLYPSRPSS